VHSGAIEVVTPSVVRHVKLTSHAPRLKVAFVQSVFDVQAKPGDTLFSLQKLVKNWQAPAKAPGRAFIVYVPPAAPPVREERRSESPTKTDGQ
jgi:hypothetical protein